MDFSLAHSFDAPVDSLADALLDRKFQDSLGDIGALSERRVLSQEDGGDGAVVRRVRCVLDVDVSGMARKLMGDGDPAWVEEATWDPARSRWDWVIHPEVAAHLLSASGGIEVSGDGRRSTRRVTGRIKVNVPLYGGRVEGWIRDGIEAAYEEEAERLADWLAG
ncbi:MAG TPA: DUF2505 domain-containing protein [Actinomycetota bacterium]|nr:DUF2505 domain-containing protein [Actinomycetota bacterium]